MKQIIKFYEHSGFANLQWLCCTQWTTGQTPQLQWPYYKFSFGMCQFQPVPFTSLDHFRFERVDENTFFETAPGLPNASRRGGILFFFVFPTAEFLPPCHVPRLLYDVTRPSWGWHHVMFPAPLDVSNSANVLRAWKVQWNKHSRILSTTTDSLLPHMGLEIEIEIIPRLFVFSYIKQYQLNSTTTHEYL